MSLQMPHSIKPVWQSREKMGFDQLTELHAIAYVATTMIAMTFMGTYYIVVFYALWLPLIYYKRQFILTPSKDLIGPAIICLYLCSSTIWSAHRDVTIRSSLEFTSLIACTVVITRIIRINDFIKGVTVGCCIALISVFIISGMHLNATLMGNVLGSKNQVAFTAEIGLYCSLMCWFIYRRVWKKALYSLFPFFLCLIFLIYSRSATSNVSLIAVLGAITLAYILAIVPTKFRREFFVFSILSLVIGISIFVFLGLQDVGLHAVGKDSTLTGRTYLWSEGLKTGMENPILGVGFGAFWAVGTPEAEKLWYQFEIYNRSGFHFHNVFVDTFVSIGIVGCLLWVWAYFYTFVKSFLNILIYGLHLELVFYVGLAVMFLVRALTEVDTTEPYGVGPVLFFYAMTRVAAYHTSRKQEGRSKANQQTLVMQS